VDIKLHSRRGLAAAIQSCCSLHEAHRIQVMEYQYPPLSFAVVDKLVEAYPRNSQVEDRGLLVSLALYCHDSRLGYFLASTLDDATWVPAICDT